MSPTTWNNINHVYNGVKRLYYINSEGLKLEDISTQYESELKLGDASPGVFVLQYYLSYISLFYPTVSAVATDGDFGTVTQNAVISYQKTFGLEPTGIIDEATWYSTQDTYYSIIARVPYVFEEGIILPYPGRVLRVGVQGNDVKALQEYLNYIANTYNEIPKITADGDFGPATAEAVNAFINLFNLPTRPGRVNALVWNAIINAYDDLYIGNIVREEQFPGYGIG